MGNSIDHSVFFKYFQELEKQALHSTVACYRTRLRLVMKFLEPAKKINECDIMDIEQIMKDISSNYSERTVKNTMLTLKRFYDWEVDNNLISVNPMSDWKPPIVCVQSFPLILTDKDKEQLLDQAKKTDVYLPILLGAYMGLRRSEALNLKWKDVLFHIHAIHIEDMIQKMPSIVEAELYQRYLDLLQKFSLKEIQEQFICKTVRDEPFEASYFNRRFRKFINNSVGISKSIKFKDLRYTYLAKQQANTIIMPDRWTGENLEKAA